MLNKALKNPNELITKDGRVVKHVIDKERESDDYDPSDIMTFKEAPLFPKIKDDLIAHLLCDQQNTKDFYFTNMYGYLSVTHQHDKSDHIIHNKLLKFSKPSGGVKIAQRMLDTLFPANIVSRYKLYDEKGFNEKTLMHYMSVPIFYHSKKAVFSVQLPDGFMKNIGSKLINIPKFEYETEKELLAKYKIDLNNFAKKYYQLFIDFQKSIKVILIECKSQKEVNLESLLSNDFNSIIKFNSHNIQSMLSFANSINITKGQLYGDVFCELLTAKAVKLPFHEAVEFPN